MAFGEVTGKGTRKAESERRGREAGFLLESFPGSEMFAAPGFLPTLIIWKDKRQLPHASTPPALQELAALIPLPEPFEVFCYLEQILQNAFESREGEGTTANSRDMDRAHRLWREAVWVIKGQISCPTCYKPVKVKKETTVVGSHAPTPPPLLQHQSLVEQHPAKSI